MMGPFLLIKKQEGNSAPLKMISKERHSVKASGKAREKFKKRRKTDKINQVR